MNTTRDLAEFAVRTRFEDLPPAVIYETKRDIINILAVALYSARDPSLPILLDAFAAEGGNERATIWGAGRRTSLQQAALMNGFLAHLEDYDDTHFPTVVHPSAPTVPAAWAIAEDGQSGRDLLAAVALGIEVCCRVALAIHPWHYDAGWHITGTAGVFGAAAAAGGLAGLSVEQMVAAFGIAGTQAAGVREVFGSMTKALHAGRAAQAGVVAALLASRGFTSTTTILEGRRGFAAVMSGDSDLSRATQSLGRRWEIFQNELKPYACGVVNHAAIDACIALRRRPGFHPQQVDSIEAGVHPLVLELVNRPEPRVGLEGKFSVQHCIAIGLVDGAAHPAQFSDARVRDSLLAALRRKVRLLEDKALTEDEAKLRITTKDGSVLEEHVRHATGAPENPLSDAGLEEKFLALVGPTVGEAAARALLDRLWRLDEASAVAELFP